jgi:hypothetical protein
MAHTHARLGHQPAVPDSPVEHPSFSEPRDGVGCALKPRSKEAEMTSLNDEEIRTGRADTLGQGGTEAADADLDDADSTDDSDATDSDSGDSSDDADAVDPDTGPADSAG